MQTSKKEEVYYLYWIHRKCHTSIKKEGYIGVTFDIEGRFTQHRCLARNNNQNHVYRAIRKYDDIEYKVLCAGSFEYICDLERELRPIENIGWNIYPGGNVARGYTISEESKMKLSASISKFSRLQALNILVDYFENSMTKSGISRKYNLSPVTITNIVNGTQKAYPDIEDVRNVLKESREFKSPHCGELPEDLYNEILTEREKGISWSKLEKLFNIPKMTIRDYCYGELDYLKKFKCYRVVKGINQPKQYLYKGSHKTLGEWSKEFDIKLSTLWARINSGWSIDKALETSVKVRP